MKADRPQPADDRQAGQEFLVFHPKCSKAAKISAKVNDNADVKRVVTEKEIEATIDHNLEVIHELQTGALSVGDEETQGAAVLRQLDLEKLRSALKRNFLEGPGAGTTEAAFQEAQTSLEKAREQNLAKQKQGAATSHLLSPKVEPLALWGRELRECMENNVFLPDHHMVDIGSSEMTDLHQAYNTMREKLLEGREAWPSALLDEVQVPPRRRRLWP